MVEGISIRQATLDDIADLVLLRSRRLLDLVRIGVGAVRTVVKDGRVVVRDGRRVGD